MTRIADLRRRVEAITVVFSGTIAAKLIKLTDDQRLAYGQWLDQRDQWHRDQPGANAYERLINGDEPPPLRRDVHTALFGATIGIPADATVAQASEIYRRFLAGE